VFTATGMCDFEGAYKGTPVCIEAKQISHHRFPITLAKHNKIKAHQVERLNLTLEMRGISGLLIRFMPKDREPAAFAVPWVLRRIVMEDGMKSFCMDDLPGQGATPIKNPAAPTAEELEGFFDLCAALARAEARR